MMAIIRGDFRRFHNPQNRIESQREQGSDE